MRRYLLKSLLAVKVLTAGDKPNFGELKILHWRFTQRIRIKIARQDAKAQRFAAEVSILRHAAKVTLKKDRGE